MRSMLWFLLLTACGDGAPEPDALSDEPPLVEEEPAVEDETFRPSLDCPDGAVQMYQAVPEGHEHFCTKAGLREGPYVRFYPDGTRAIEGSFDRDQPDGPWLWNHPSGKKQQRGAYRRGQKTANWTRWFEDGTIEEVGDYIHNRKSGQWTHNYPSGRVRVEGMYQNDMKHGSWRYFLDQDEENQERVEVWHAGELKSTEPSKRR